MFVSSVWLTHAILLIRISKFEKALKQQNKILLELNREVSKKEIEYENLIDLEKIENEMKKAKMSRANEIKFFTIEE